MNIIEKISKNNDQRNIILFDSINNKDLLSIKKMYKLDKWLECSMFIYKVYNGDIYNPPFFNNIIVLKKYILLEDIKYIWNMTLLGGYIFVNKTYKSLFMNSVIYENKSYMLINKNMNITYQFPKYRILDFIIAGTMKGGTTAGITNFSKHPDISMVKNEIHYFDKKEVYQKGVNWYKSHFNYSKKMVGDKAPDVMYQKSCLELLQITNPQVKIILFLRNPIDRAYSHWKMTRDHFGNNCSFEYSINDEIKNRWGENRLYYVAFWTHFIQRGLYYEQILEILKYFPKDNLYIVISEKVRNNMDEEYQKIFNFLGLLEYHDTFEEIFVSQKKDTIDKKSNIYKVLKKIYNSDVKKLEKFIKYKTEWW